jgi:hypothetical protein
MTRHNGTKSSRNTKKRFKKIKLLRPSKWLNLLEPSWLNLAIISSLLGGLIFLVYFWNIKYFPELDSQSLLFFLAAITPLGFLLVFPLASFLLFPGIIWTYILDLDTSMYSLLSKNRITTLKSLALKKIKLNISENNNFFLEKSCEFDRHDYAFSKPKICIAYLYAFLIGCLLSSVFILFGIKNESIFSIRRIVNFNLTTQVMACILFTLCFLLFVFAVLVIYKSYSKFTIDTRKKTFLKSLLTGLKLFGYSIIIFVLFFCNWLIISAFLSQSTDGSNHSLMMNEVSPIVCATFVACLATNLVVICRYPKKQLSFFLDFCIGFFVLVLLIVYLGKVMIIPGKIMNAYGWGNIDNASIVVNRTGCQAIESMNIKIGSCSEKDRTYKVERVCILSSIGKNYYLRFPKCNLQKGDPMPTELALEKTNIISWSRQNLSQGEPKKL